MAVSHRDLLRRIRKKKSKLENKGKIAGNNRKGLSIEKRPKEVNNRQEFGHREIDLVIGKHGSKQCLFTLTERTTRKEIIIKIPNKRQKSILKAINRLEKKLW
jgi:IS30 family transposase